VAADLRSAAADGRRTRRGAARKPDRGDRRSALAWLAGLLLVFVPLAVRAYRRA
jgi:hypothetical protein